MHHRLRLPIIGKFSDDAMLAERNDERPRTNGITTPDSRTVTTEIVRSNLLQSAQNSLAKRAIPTSDTLHQSHILWRWRLRLLSSAAHTAVWSPWWRRLQRPLLSEPAN